MSQVFRLAAEKLYVAQEILDRFIRCLILQGPHPRLAVLVDQRTSQQPKPASLSQNSPEELIGDGILWAVPKSRRSRERRLLRKFGSESGHKKMLPILKLLTCDDCGHVHEPGRLCPNCYAKNIEITEAMQEAMNSTQGLNPIEHEVLPVFKGENINTKDGFFQGKQVVEVARERPQWFSRRLTLKSNITTSSDTTTAKPTNLA
ncbi:39S ribosomal protein L32, mitochondrial-like [Homarus americanus]|uniref:39S ribosomal protein L32-like n=1 Tax=Homarus americanus TaxID=6706 RepID=A0A8J5JEP9_HOMAM|nr:39S ribosomal protein L32, mitochondrial-like [Homarus americanus]KAG7156330.1 39S ribosomal protein L32-like [Homarus americanus]